MGHAGQVQSTHASAHTGLCPRVASHAQRAHKRAAGFLLCFWLRACVAVGTSSRSCHFIWLAVKRRH